MPIFFYLYTILSCVICRNPVTSDERTGIWKRDKEKLRNEYKADIDTGTNSRCSCASFLQLLPDKMQWL